MSESVMPRSALAGAAPWRGTGAALALEERAGSTLLHLEGARPGGELAAMLAALGLERLPQGGRSGGRSGARLLGLGPETWLLVVEPQAALPAALTLAGAAGRAFAAPLDASHAYTRLAIAGGKAEELISKGCALDLHERHFPPGACAATAFAGRRTILWRVPEGGRVELFVPRSYALSLWEWLIDAAAEHEGPGAAPGGL